MSFSLKFKLTRTYLPLLFKKIIKRIKNITLKRTIMAMIRDEALDWKLNFGNSELL